jgi:hypothetical protein
MLYHTPLRSTLSQFSGMPPRFGGLQVRARASRYFQAVKDRALPAARPMACLLPTTSCTTLHHQSATPSDNGPCPHLWHIRCARLLRCCRCRTSRGSSGPDRRSARIGERCANWSPGVSWRGLVASLTRPRM